MSISQRSSSFIAVRVVIAAAICVLFFTVASFHTKAADFSLIHFVGEFLGLQSGVSVHQDAGVDPKADIPETASNGKIVFIRNFESIYVVDPNTTPIAPETLLGPGIGPVWKLL